MLENDGRPLNISRLPAIVSTGYPAAGDRQNFIALNAGSTLDDSAPPLRSTFGDLRPVLVTAPGDIHRSFIYPANAIQPSPEAVRQSFRRTGDGFHSVLGRVVGNIYVGQIVAGGEGASVDLNGDGKPDIVSAKLAGS